MEKVYDTPTCISIHLSEKQPFINLLLDAVFIVDASFLGEELTAHTDHRVTADEITAKNTNLTEEIHL